MAEPSSTFAAAATPPGGDFSLASTAITMAGALLLLLAVILGAFYLLKRFGPKIGLGLPGRTDHLKYLGQLSLGPKKSVVMVRFLNRTLVLGVTEHSINLLTETNADADHAQHDFAQTLEKTAGEDPPS